MAVGQITEVLDFTAVLHKVVELRQIGLAHSDRFITIRDWVRGRLSDDELEVVVSSYRLDGPEAAFKWLQEHFRELDKDVLGEEEHGVIRHAFDMTFVPFRFVRIRPDCRREVHVMPQYNAIFRREAGWHEVSRALGAACAAEPLHEGSPRGHIAFAPVFDVAINPPKGRVVQVAHFMRDKKNGEPI